MAFGNGTAVGIGVGVSVTIAVAGTGVCVWTEGVVLVHPEKRSTKNSTPNTATVNLNSILSLRLDRCCIYLLGKQLPEEDIRYLLRSMNCHIEVCTVIPLTFVHQINLEVGIKKCNYPQRCDHCTPF